MAHLQHTGGEIGVTAQPQAAAAVLHEIVDQVDVKTIGQCKWFNAALGYGFLTICNGPDAGKDIFVHHSGIKPSNSHYRTLWKGEYVSFSQVSGPNGPQATNVTGVCGGSLMCDVAPLRRPPPPPPPPPGGGPFLLQQQQQQQLYNMYTHQMYALQQQQQQQLEQV